jgi:hypothetical protein
MTVTASRGGARQRPNWFYWLVAVYSGLHLVWLVFLAEDFVTHPLAPDRLSGSVAFRWLLALVVMPATLLVALLVLRRTRGNVIGLCLLLMSALIMGATLPASSPLLPYNSVLNSGWSGLWLLGLYFPDGQPQPARLGGPIRVLSALSLLSNATSNFFGPVVPMNETLSAPNPLFVEALGPLRGLASGVQQGLLFSVAVLILFSLVWRYRVSDWHSRLQLKWLGWAFGLLILSSMPLWISALAAGGSDPFSGLGRLPVTLIALYIYVFPSVTVGIAILRHRLYDIDLIIRRTLVYSVLTGLLALAYFGAVLVLENVFRTVTGQTQNSLAAVLSTLAIAALFVPLRSRVQRAIDRRFFRSKYDAARTLAAFSAHTRDETNIDGLEKQLLDVTHETLRPKTTSLWLKPIPGQSHRGDGP